ncbi:hypothetical protein B0T16DRAFT_451055 [Cercophora newfieldiana]|uniref:Uncharacterized protein n=1 Tax=Cercophora newfieldiana TaxID=92897 RepID=A0AA39YNZ8_9PEZI|nr:hypothetical protein B0T16DRAFT_451055 [Cercophora newfieldiana]
MPRGISSWILGEKFEQQTGEITELLERDDVVNNLRSDSPAASSDHHQQQLSPPLLMCIYQAAIKHPQRVWNDHKAPALMLVRAGRESRPRSPPPDYAADVEDSDC